MSAEGEKQRSSDHENDSHQAFLDRFRAIRARKEDKVSVVILINRNDGTQDRFEFRVRRTSLVCAC